MDHEQTMGVNSKVLDQKQQNIFDRISLFCEKVVSIVLLEQLTEFLYNCSFLFNCANVIYRCFVVTASASAQVRCPQNVSNVFADEWASQQCGQHEQHLSAGGFYELFLQHPTTDRFDMLCR